MLLSQTFSLELKRRFSYVLDFWLRIILPPITQIIVAYFLWDAIYPSREEKIGGMTFNEMMLYYVVASGVYQMVQPEIAIVLEDIVEGTLTKYLVYPTSYLKFKFTGHMAQVFLASIQLIIGLSIFWYLFPETISVYLNIFNVGGFILSVILASYLFFIMCVGIELMAFWVELIWSLVVMLQIIAGLLGGRMIPLSVFPEWAQNALVYSPFPYLVSWPTSILLGQKSAYEFIAGSTVCLLWSLFFTYIAIKIWDKGSYQYSGIGM